VHIIVDGYNLIRRSDELKRFDKKSLEEGREALLRHLMRYKKHKGHKITVVFDGWESGSFQEKKDRQGGIEIIYYRRGEKADEVIKRLGQCQSEEFVVVTSDRDIANFIEKRGGTGIGSRVFEAMVERTFLAGQDKNTASDNDESDEKPTGKKGPSHRPSRKKRVALAKMKKL
jgi:hypothetical protein